VEVHKAIADKAIAGAGSTLDATLKALGLSQGGNTELQDGMVRRTARNWVIEGSKLEDVPATRVVHHFHHPLAFTWQIAGLGFPPWATSAVLWQQHASQDTVLGLPGPGSWSWPNARDRYREALTLATKLGRDAALARALRALGQVLHLLQDASLPAHTRNDDHLYFTVGPVDIGFPDGYERHVDKLDPLELAGPLSLSVRPVDTLFTVARNAPRMDPASLAQAPTPITTLIDTGQYTGANPEVTSIPGAPAPSVGLAEYSHANFFSDDTIFADQSILGRIPFPSLASVDPTPRLESYPRTGRSRYYFWKSQHGDTGYRLVTASALHGSVIQTLAAKTMSLDALVFQDYATRLLPRAVGYSAALVDYFFRGRLALTVDPNGVLITNGTPSETMDGTFTLYAETADGTRTSIGSWTLALAAMATSAVLPVPPLPADTPSTTFCVLVFTGQLGPEPNAVAGAVVDCPIEPIPPPPPPPPPDPPPPPEIEEFGQYWVTYHFAGSTDLILGWFSIPCLRDPYEWVPILVGWPVVIDAIEPRVFGEGTPTEYTVVCEEHGF
jgi:hypothetical protein